MKCYLNEETNKKKELLTTTHEEFGFSKANLTMGRCDLDLQ